MRIVLKCYINKPLQQLRFIPLSLYPSLSLSKLNHSTSLPHQMHQPQPTFPHSHTAPPLLALFHFRQGTYFISPAWRFSLSLSLSLPA